VFNTHERDFHGRCFEPSFASDPLIGSSLSLTPLEDNGSFFGNLQNDYLFHLRNDVLDRLQAYHPDANCLIQFLDESFHNAKDAIYTREKYASITGDFPALNAYIGEWVSTIKKICGVHNPDKVKAAMAESVASIVIPAKAGKTIHPGQRIDAQIAGRMALQLQSMADGFEERHDVRRYFSESDYYKSTSGTARLLLNQTLRAFFQKLDLPCPPLMAAPSRIDR
jgi:hypothetical protein